MFLVAAFLIPAFVLPFYNRNARAVDTNATIRAYLTMALVDDMTSAVDRQAVQYGLPLDRAEKDGHIYSDKAPGLSLLAVPAYCMVRLFGRFAGVRVPFPLTVYIMRISTVGLLNVLLLYWMLKLMRRCVEESIAFLCATLYCMGTIALPMSTSFLGHQAAAALSFLAYYALRNGMVERRAALVFLSGALAGASVITEYPTVLIAVSLFFLIAASRQGRPLAPVFLLGAAPFATAILLYNCFTFGSCLAFSYGYTQHYFKILGLDETGIAAALSIPSWGRLREMAFSSYRGVFFYSPALLFALWGLRILYASGLRAKSLLLQALACVYFLFNACMRDWEGGWSPGLRHLTPLVPFLVPPLALAAQRIARMPDASFIKKLAGTLLCATFLISMLHCCLIAATYMYFPWGVYNPLRDVCLAFLAGGAWVCMLPAFLRVPDPLGPLIFAAGAAVSLWSFCRAGFRRLLPGAWTKTGTALILGVWIWCISALPSACTLQGDRFLALLYWDNMLYARFLDASSRIIEKSGDREERMRYAEHGIYTACEILKEPRRAVWFYGMYLLMRGERTAPPIE